MASEHDVEITTEQGAIETTYLYEYASRACAQVRRITERGDAVHPERPVVASERGGPLTASSVTQWFFPLYRDVGMTGWSSHSGRRTFITRAARKVSEVGGSVRDVQQLAGHASLQTTQRYLEGDTDAKRKLVQLI